MRRLRTWGIAGLALCFIAATWTRADNVDLTGSWMFTNEGTGEHATVEIKQDGTSVAGTVAPTPKGDQKHLFDGKQLFAGTLSGLSATGTIKMADDANRRNPPPVTDTGMRFTVSQNADGLRIDGQYDFQRYNYDKEAWQPPNPGDSPKVAFSMVPMCRPVSGPIPMGRAGGFDISITLSEPVHVVDPAKDDAKIAGYCHYSGVGVGGVAINMLLPGGASGPPLGISGCDVEFYLKEGADPSDPKSYQQVSLSWSDDETNSVPVFSRWGLSFNLYSVGLDFHVNQDDGSVTISEGYAEVKMAATGDTQIYGPVYLGGNPNGIIRFDWQPNSDSWSNGQWSFDGLHGAQLQVRRDGLVPIATLDLDFNSQGDATGKLVVEPDCTWNLDGFDISIDECELNGFVSLRGEGAFELRAPGSLRGTLKTQGPSAQSLKFELAYKEDRTFYFGVVNDGSIRLFGGTCTSLALSANLDTDTLDFTRIDGQFAWKHDQFDTAITISAFSLVDGRLQTFKGAGAVEFENFKVSIQDIDYSADLGRLSVTGKLNLGWSAGGDAAVEMRNFTIDSTGTISSFEIEANLNATPANLHFLAAYKDRSFSGDFDGSISGGIRIQGSVVVGVASNSANAGADFTYGYLELNVRLANGVPIGQSGLQLLGLGGGFGCNYLPNTKVPEYGAYYLMGQITIGDMAGMASLQGKLEIILGAQSTAFQITGTLQATQSTPYFVGSLSCAYVLGSGSLSGDLTSTVKIPQSGSIISIEKNTLHYSVGSNAWGVQGDNLGGQFFQVLNVSNGSVMARSTFASPIGDLSGSLGAHLSGGTSQSLSTSFLGVGLKAGLQVSVLGDISSQINSSGISGSFSMTASAIGTATVTVPGNILFDPYTFSKEISAQGSVTGTSNGQSLHIDANLQISLGLGLSGSVPLSYDI